METAALRCKVAGGIDSFRKIHGYQDERKLYGYIEAIFQYIGPKVKVLLQNRAQQIVGQAK